jgi:hypothetical protein
MSHTRHDIHASAGTSSARWIGGAFLVQKLARNATLAGPGHLRNRVTPLGGNVDDERHDDVAGRLRCLLPPLRTSALYTCLDPSAA